MLLLFILRELRWKEKHCVEVEYLSTSLIGGGELGQFCHLLL